MKIVSFFESIKIWWWVENVQANLSRWLVEKWYDFTHLLLQDRTPRNDYKWKIVSLNEEFTFWFWIKKIISLFRLWYKVAKYCKREKIDAIIWQGDFFYMVVSISKILFWNRSKTIGVVHTTIWIWPKYIKSILIFLLKKFDKVILISKEELNTFISKYSFDKSKLELIYNPIDLDLINSKLSQPLSIEYDYLFNNWKFTFINVWRLTYQKNQKLLVQAFDEFYKQNKNSQLIILWDWELKVDLLDLKNSLESKDNIFLLWKQENIFPFLKKSDCFVLSSLFEGFWIVLIEAMVSKLPIISTKCPSWPTEILWWKINWEFEISDNAILTKNNSLKDIINAMNIVYNNSNIRNNFSLNNLNKVKIFNIKNNIKLWNELLIKFF